MSHHRSTRRLAIATALLVTFGPMAAAHVFRYTPPPLSAPGLVEVKVETGDIVGLLSGLAKIESDLQLGMLFLQDGLVNPEGSHFTHPRAETYPDIKDSLVAAGIADFEPQLIALEAGGDKAVVTAAYTDAVAALMGARSTLQPSARDMLMSIIAQAQAVADEIDPSGVTEPDNFQDAWAMLMVARSQIDLLMRDPDAGIAAAAKDMGLALDDIIISMPDPNVSSPVSFDRAPLLDLISRLEAAAGAA